MHHLYVSPQMCILHLVLRVCIPCLLWMMKLVPLLSSVGSHHHSYQLHTAIHRTYSSWAGFFKQCQDHDDTPNCGSLRAGTARSSLLQLHHEASGRISMGFDSTLCSPVGTSCNMCFHEQNSAQVDAYLATELVVELTAEVNQWYAQGINVSHFGVIPKGGDNPISGISSSTSPTCLVTALITEFS